MTGPEHYRAAERLLSDASFTSITGTPVTREGQQVDPKIHATLINLAQVHATLAHAAAAADLLAAYSYEHKCVGAAVDEWAAVLAKPGGNAELEQHGTPEEAGR